ncbi:MAG: pre-peptidase C-terminal domain-containing protein, partial [Anaerolineales bacterium]|nr:pre-peptidase C-terminal domain-containing protein [Anaerolineales bacterium]
SVGYYLRFWYRYETETQGQGWDQRWVQISVDGGAFNDVLQLSDDPMLVWLQSPAITLSGYVGHTIQVRFHFDTLDDVYNDYRGWYIDDFGISTTPPPSCADTHEPNNNASQTTVIAYGQTFSADICPGGDFDFYSFIGAAGDKIVVDIDAEVNGSLLDSYIFLLDSDGTSVLAEHDDEITYEVKDSKLGYNLPHDGTYYVKVRAWNHPSVGGTDYFYTIHLLTDDVNPSSAAITSPANDAWLNPNMETVTVTASDNESGINRVEFLWHSADWENSDWVWLGADQDGRDGWSWTFDTSGLAEQRGAAFYIWAFDWVGNWTGAGVWNLGIDRTPTPPAPTGVLASDGTYTDKVLVSWNASSGATSYEVYRATSATGTKSLLGSPTGTSFDDTTATPAVTYYYWVKACSGANCSDFSAYDTGRRKKLSAPTNVQASDGTYTDKVLVTWNASSGAPYYKVYRATSATGTKNLLGSPTGTPFDDATATPAVTYTYWVKACSGTKCSGFSAYNTGWRKLSAPINVQASDGTYANKVQVTWDASSGATSYKVYRAASETGTKSLLGSPTGTSFNDTTAKPGVTYHYWVKAYRGSRDSDFSAFDTGWRKP